MRTFRQLLLMLTLTLCGTVFASAYEYFTICFHDGTRSGVFYTNSIDSIRYSTIDLDSTLYSEWKVQEIWTTDSVYRYRLADIDSLSFTNVNVDRVAENIAHISSYINPLYLQSKSSYELLQRINEINNFDYVENVSIDEQSLFVTIKDWGDLTYSYPPKPTADIEPITVNHAPHFIPNKHRKSIAGYPITVHKQKEVKNVCVVKQISKNEDPIWEKSLEQIELTKSLCSEWGFNVTSLNSLSVDFFAKDIKKYDLVFLFTHGTYNGLHWFATSEEIYCQPINKIVDEDSLNRVAKDFILNKYYKNGYANNEIGFDILLETRDGVPTIVCNTWISEKFIARHRNPSSKNIILFNGACKSMKGGPSAAIAFNNSGVDCYTGFNESNSIAPWTYTNIILRMLSGMSLYSSIDKLPEHLKTEKFVPEGWKEEVTTTLQLYPNNQSKSAICLTHPTTLASKVVTSNGIDAIELAGKIQMLDGSLIVEAGGHFGFLLSDNLNPEPSNSIDINDITYDVTDYETTSTLRYNANINKAELPSNARYYRAYLFDGKSLCLGEVKELELKQEPYVVLNDGTLTFYYDDKKAEREGTVYDIKKEYTSYYDRPQWVDAGATKAVFDSSFADYRPTSTAWWFSYCSNIQTIDSLHNLKTSNVLNMENMFSGCSSLTSLDVSNFDTSNVTDMWAMFSGCSSLTSIDLSNFATSDVTNMVGMFEMCSSLTSLDLRSFNTSKVTDMYLMFSGCSSLTSLDLSNFDTSNVTFMRQMFSDCSSLTSLDLSNFNTSNVPEMDRTFSGCSSLTYLNMRNAILANNCTYLFEDLSALKEIDLSNANTSNVTNMYGMFYRCKSLTSLDVSSFNTSNVTDMENMFDGCSSLTSLDLSNFKTSNVTSIREMFDGCSSLTSLDLSNFNTSNVTNMAYMFEDCSSLKSLDISNFDMSKAYVEHILRGDGTGTYCTSLTYLNMRNAILPKNCSYLFAYLSALKEIDLSNANTSNVTDMGDMFYGCKSLTSLDLSSFDTSNVTVMWDMFEYCSSLTSLDLSSFDTSNVTRMSSMFSRCYSLTTIYAGNWKYVSSSSGMFSLCDNLRGGKGTKIGYNIYGYDQEGYPLYYKCAENSSAAHIDGGKDNPGLFTAK